MMGLQIGNCKMQIANWGEYRLTVTRRGARFRATRAPRWVAVKRVVSARAWCHTCGAQILETEVEVSP
jgi:hypothetical protein